MKPLIKKIVGLKKSELDEAIGSEGGIRLRHARLIPAYKIGDELALTSIFLSSLKMIKEFRDNILSTLGMSRGGTIYVYTEAEFPQFKDCRIDGLILVVKSGIIQDAAFLEMKNKNDLLKADQIEKYLKIANELSVPKMVTISNQFVSTQTQSPVNLKAPKSVGMYHLSWSYILTIAHVLLIKNDMNIKDEDQANIMREVVAYFENSASGVCGFHQMKAGWAKTVDKINSNMVIKANDPDLSEAVLSWQQEEKDMALILSRKLGVLVGTGYPKYKNDLIGRYKDDAKKLLTDKMLNSLLRVKGACSDLTVKAFFDRRIVEISITLEAPKDKKVKGQIGWLRKQLEQGQKKNPNSYERIKDDLFMEAVVKFSRQDERMPTSRTDELCDHLKGKEVVTLNVVYVKDFGKGFSSSKKFVKIIETMLVDFYRGVVQNITKWKPPTPKIQQRVTVVSNEDSSGDELCNNEDSNN